MGERKPWSPAGIPMAFRGTLFPLFIGRAV
jgi:hypothetical protein